jgi:hypothetical protein
MIGKIELRRLSRQRSCLRLRFRLGTCRRKLDAESRWTFVCVYESEMGTTNALKRMYVYVCMYVCEGMYKTRMCIFKTV